MKFNHKKYITIICSTTILLTSTQALANDKTNQNALDNIINSASKAIAKGTTYGDIRYRFEHVDQSNFAKDAKASTIRTRIGYKTEEYKNLSAVIEFEDVTAIGREMYNDAGGTASNANYPAVADPVDTELNQAFIKFTGLPKTQATYGRKRIVLNNARFVGDVGWRQNNQTFDGATLSTQLIPHTKLFYGYIYNVNRIFSNNDVSGDFDGNIHLVDAKFSKIPFGTLHGYNYYIDLEDSAANSSNTYGLSFKGNKQINNDIKALYHIEFAKQSDAGDNTTNYNADYIHTNAGITYKNLTVKAGYEELGSDSGNFAFRTPLATLHKFNGWSDQFLNTPTNGLEDIYGSLTYKVNDIHPAINGTKITAKYHDFAADNGGTEYGKEWNINISKSFYKYFSTGVKYASYDSERGAVASNDVDKVIFSLGFKY